MSLLSAVIKPLPIDSIIHLSEHMRRWYLSHRRVGEALTRLRTHTQSMELDKDLIKNKEL